MTGTPSPLRIELDALVEGLKPRILASIASAAFVPLSALGTSVATLVGGIIPSVQLPGYVDDVIEVADFDALPVIGETGKIYVTLGSTATVGANLQFRWSGSAYVQIVASPGSTDGVPEGAVNLYHTAARVNALIAAAGGIGGIGGSWPMPGNAQGTIPYLVATRTLEAGTYATIAATLGATDAARAATIQLKSLSSSTVLATIGGTAGGLGFRVSASSFTLAAPTDVGIYLFGDSPVTVSYMTEICIKP